jgi:membrane protein implicated in regulation of membrane protease activity
MNLDIRLPIGLLFAILGGLLAVFGLVTGFTGGALYDRSLGININLWWGLVMLAFGIVMIVAGRRGTTDERSGQDGEPHVPHGAH